MTALGALSGFRRAISTTFGPQTEGCGLGGADPLVRCRRPRRLVGSDNHLILRDKGVRNGRADLGVRPTRPRKRGPIKRGEPKLPSHTSNFRSKQAEASC